MQKALFARRINAEHPILKVTKLHNIQEPAIVISVGSHYRPWAKPIDGWYDNITPTKALRLLKRIILDVFEELQADSPDKVLATKNDIIQFISKTNNS